MPEERRARAPPPPLYKRLLEPMNARAHQLSKMKTLIEAVRKPHGPTQNQTRFQRKHLMTKLNQNI